MIEAAFLDRIPGTIHLLNVEEAAGISAKAHTLPMNKMARYLEKTMGCTVSLIGIQPEDIIRGNALSPSVILAVDEFIQAVQNLFVDETMVRMMTTT
jgi:hydrogenase maturation protease